MPGKISRVSIAVSSLCVLGVCCAFAWNSKAAQGLGSRNIKIEDWPQAYQNKEPVKIIGLYLGTTPIKSGEDFQADNDWLRDLRVMVKNVSDQSIRQVILNLDLPTDDPSVGVRRIEIFYGRDYWSTRTPDAKVPEVLLAPKALATFGYTTNYPNAYAHLQQHLKRDHHHTLPSKGSISLGAVVFEDIDTGWTMTKYVVRHPRGWAGDPSKAHLNGGREQSKSSTGQARLNAMKASFASGKPLPQCWDIPSPPDPVSTQENCTVPPAACTGCKYQKPILNSAETEFQRQQTSKPC